MMKTLIIGSVCEDAGKTSLIVGLARILGKKFGYLKPFGDRLIYRKKRLWDYDSALLTNIFGLEQSSEDMTIGFEHAKLRYMYDEASTRSKLQEMVRNLGDDNQILFVEGGKDLTYGTSVRLDTLSLARYLGGKLIIVASGDEGTILDDVTFLKKYVNMSDLEFTLVVNKVNNIDDYASTHLQDIKEMGIKVAGIIPFQKDLTYVNVSYIAERLQARVISGEGGLNNKVKHVFVGAMSGDAAVRLPLFKIENKLAITSGDRSDMIVAALESSTAGIVLTNNVIPAQNIIAKAAEKNIPLLLVPYDTFQTAKRVDDMPTLLTRDDTERINLLEKLIKEHIDIDAIL
ncbi:MAG: DRTGG domain-containing protein [Dehalococcoidales bacterium]|jgi:BioD-like phosphotransacetylase family protein|nr:DRTGG domain-containing protein [Dehalococcoidales bacterium]